MCWRVRANGMRMGEASKVATIPSALEARCVALAIQARNQSQPSARTRQMAGRLEEGEMLTQSNPCRARGSGREPNPHLVPLKVGLSLDFSAEQRKAWRVLVLAADRVELAPRPDDVPHELGRRVRLERVLPRAQSPPEKRDTAEVTNNNNKSLVSLLPKCPHQEPHVGK